MADGAVSTGISYFGWAFLPNFATGLLQDFYYRLTTRAGQRRPQPGDQLYAYHHRRIRVLVLSLYLIYTLAQALYDIKLAGDFYTLLGVTPYTSDREIKAKFRRLAARLHPDKVRENGAASPMAEAAFVRLKLAQDTILDPAKRFAYDRFGPVIVQVQHPGLKSIRDYVYAGLRGKIPEYVGNAVMLVVLNYVWLPKWGQYWRYFAVAVMAFLEFYFLTHAWNPPTTVLDIGTQLARIFPHLLPPHLLPFQILTLARHLSMSLNIFISQLAPPSARTQVEQDRQTQQQIAHLAQAANSVDSEANSLLQLSLIPFKGDTGKVQSLRTGMKENIVMSTIKNSPEVRAAVRSAIERRKQGPILQETD